MLVDGDVGRLWSLALSLILGGDVGRQRIDGSDSIVDNSSDEGLEGGMLLLILLLLTKMMTTIMMPMLMITPYFHCHL